MPKLKAGLNNWFMRKREFNLEFPDRPRTREKKPSSLHRNLGVARKFTSKTSLDPWQSIVPFHLFFLATDSSVKNY